MEFKDDDIWSGAGGGGGGQKASGSSLPGGFGVWGAEVQALEVPTAPQTLLNLTA